MTSTSSAVSTMSPVRLEDVLLLASLSAADRDELALALRPFEVAAGTKLFRQGETSDGAYILTGGHVRLTVRLPGAQLLHLGTLSPGEVLGELGLVDGAPRSATATAVEHTQGYRLSREAYAVMHAALRPSAYKLLREIALELAERVRKMIHDLGDANRDGIPDLVGRPAVDMEAEVVASSPTRPPFVGELSALASLRDGDEQALHRLLATATAVEIPRRVALIRQGEPAGRCFLVVRGAVEPTVARADGAVKLPLVAPGGTIGEVALLDGLPQPVTCVTRERSVLLELDRPLFETLLDGDDMLGFRWLDLVVAVLLDQLRRLNRRYAWLAAQEQGSL